MESRRDFLKKAAVAAAGLTIVPSKTIAGLGHKAPSDTMNIVGIGIGGKGHPNLVGMKTENIIGLCDIDWKSRRTASRNSRTLNVIGTGERCSMSWATRSTVSW